MLQKKSYVMASLASVNKAVANAAALAVEIAAKAVAKAHAIAQNNL